MPRKREPEDKFRFLQYDQLSKKPVKQRIPGLLTTTGNVLINAYRKAGKTSLIMDLIGALTTEQKFLGTLPCDQLGGPMVYLNIELEQSMLRHYAEGAGLRENEDVYYLDFCGHLSKFQLADEAWRLDLADALYDIGAAGLVIDPIHPIISMAGGSSDDNDEGRMVCELLSEIRREADMDHLFVIDHTGHADKTRARGASAKEDWADILWNVQSAGQEGTGRLLKAKGRGLIEKDAIHYELNQDGRLVVSAPDGGNVGKRGPAPKAANAVRTALFNSDDPLTIEEIMAETGFSLNSVKNNLAEMKEMGNVECKTRKGAGKTLEYYIPNRGF